MEHNMDEILERATHYYDYTLSKIQSLIRSIMAPYDACRIDIRDAMKSSAVHTTRDALTKPEAILLLLKLTENDYETIKTLPHDQLPLHINNNFIFPDIEALYKYRLKNG